MSVHGAPGAQQSLLCSPGRKPFLPVLPRVDGRDILSVVVVVLVRGDQDVSDDL
jgi:hypothetical protein